MAVKFETEEVGWLLKRVLDRINTVRDNPEYPEADKVLVDFLSNIREKLYELMKEDLNGNKNDLEPSTERVIGISIKPVLD